MKVWKGRWPPKTEEEPDDLEVHHGRHEPGAEFDSTTGRVDAEADAADEIDASSNQSLVPSSFGMTFCVDGDVAQIEVEATWGQYVRVYDHEHTKTVNKKIKDAEGNVDPYRASRSQGQSLATRSLRRQACRSILSKASFPSAHRTASTRKCAFKAPSGARIANGDRLITLFLVNAQQEPEENKDLRLGLSARIDRSRGDGIDG